MSQRRSRSQRMEQKLFHLANQILLGIVIDDLTRYKGDAIVNAANERMLGGGGVDGAIHRAAGRRLLEACRKVPEVSRGVRCPTGEARITPGFDLPAKYVIHTVGPIYSSDEESTPLLEASFRSSLDLAAEKELRSIAFPAISCGVYGYPIPNAAAVAVKTCIDFSESQDAKGTVKQIDFVLFSPDIYEAWVEAAQRLTGQHPADTEDEDASEVKKAAISTPAESADEESGGEEGGDGEKTAKTGAAAEAEGAKEEGEPGSVSAVGDEEATTAVDAMDGVTNEEVAGQEGDAIPPVEVPPPPPAAAGGAPVEEEEEEEEEQQQPGEERQGEGQSVPMDETCDAEALAMDDGAAVDTDKGGNDKATGNHEAPTPPDTEGMSFEAIAKEEKEEEEKGGAEAATGDDAASSAMSIDAAPEEEDEQQQQEQGGAKEGDSNDDHEMGSPSKASSS